MVFGEPAPAGSRITGRRKDGSIFTRPASEGLKGWQADCAKALARAWGTGPLLDEPVRVEMIFVRPRPSTHFLRGGGLSAAGRREPVPVSGKDSDKLARAVNDALQGTILRNDSRVADLRVSRPWGDRRALVLRLFRLARREPPPGDGSARLETGG